MKGIKIMIKIPARYPLNHNARSDYCTCKRCRALRTDAWEKRPENRPSAEGGQA
jgi:hypothetical protein